VTASPRSAEAAAGNGSKYLYHISGGLARRRCCAALEQGRRSMLSSGGRVRTRNPVAARTPPSPSAR